MLSARFPFWLLFFMALEKASGILDADYYIQNLEDPHLCIEGGAAKERLTASVGIFHEGTLGVKACRNKLEQQWHFMKIGPFHGSHMLFNISSAAPEVYISGRLSAKITGFFMRYWHNPMELIPLGKEEARLGFYIIKKPDQDACVENPGEGRLLKISPCDLNSMKQIWSFRLVTQGIV
ncbi:unnamed protein product [Allacma fusca]|uniref:Ricin B lectin domain-containing protein n=1 Tax=Allacma fusca TaxID=39272 RepID=A0A8J2PMA4_9HEXA|nr:unnamed protein product [Allacma fusca]